MTHHVAVRDAMPSDAPAFANSQIEAWRAAYAGILDPEYLAGLDAERLTRGWTRILGTPVPNVRQLAITVDGTAIGWELDGGTKLDTRFSPPLLELRMSAPLG